MQNNKTAFLRRILKKRVWYILVLVLVRSYIGVSSVLYSIGFKWAIDSAVSKNSKGLFHGLLFIGCILLSQVLMRCLMRYLDERSKASMENVLKLDLHKRLLMGDYSKVTKQHSGEWLNRLTSDTQVVAMGLTEILPAFMEMAVKMLAAVVMIFLLRKELFFVIVAAFVVTTLASSLLRGKVKGLHKASQEADGKVRVGLLEDLENLMVVKAYAVEGECVKRASEDMDEHLKARLRKNAAANFATTGFALGMNAMFFTGMVYGAYALMEGQMSYGTMMALLQLISQLQNPLASMTGFLPRFIVMMGSVERLMEAEVVGEDVVSLDENEVINMYRDEFKSIIAKNISFGYDDEKGASFVEIPDFILEKGQCLAIMGDSGSGKTTLLKLLLGLYSGYSGELLIDKGDICELTAMYRGLFAYVPQGGYIVSGNIRNIITMGAEYDKARMDEALEISCAKEFAREDIVLGERGNGLSGGQLQRLAIARAVYSKRPIIILDEATSGLDAATEEKVLSNLRALKDRTFIIVTHRNSALAVCDSVVYVKNRDLK